MAAGNVPPCRFFVCLIGQPGKAERGTVLTGAGMGMPLACMRTLGQDPEILFAALRHL